MPNDDDMNGGGILKRINLPEIVAGPAGKAISRLVASVVDIPVAYLNARTREIQGRTDAARVVSQAVAKAVAKQAAQDPAIIERAMDALVASEYRKQSNKETIATKTIEQLQVIPNSSDADGAVAEPDPDWMNIFERHAKTRRPSAFRTYGRACLLGIRKPKSFSPKTLGFIAELDAEVAGMFERLCPSIVEGLYIPFTKDLNDNNWSELLEMQILVLLRAWVSTYFVSMFLLQRMVFRFAIRIIRCTS